MSGEQIIGLGAILWFCGFLLAGLIGIGVAYPSGDPGENLLRAIWWPLVLLRWIAMGFRLVMQGLWLELKSWK